MVSFVDLLAPGAALLLVGSTAALLLMGSSAVAAVMLLVSSGPPSAVGCRLAGWLLMGSAAALLLVGSAAALLLMGSAAVLLLVGSTAGPLQRRVFFLRSCLHTFRCLRVNAHCGFAQCASDLSENQAPAWTPDAVTDTLMDLAQQEENPFPLHEILPNCQENLGSHKHGRRCGLVPQVYVVAFSKAANVAHDFGRGLDSGSLPQQARKQGAYVLGADQMDLLKKMWII